MARRRLLSSERGFTLIELLVATTILAVGILGTVTMVDTSNATTSETKGREGATALGRAVMEIARSVPYKDMNAQAIEDELNTHTGLDDSSAAAGYQIDSRNFIYDLTITVCSVDDVKDGYGVRDAAADPPFCTDNTTPPAGDPLKDKNPDDYRRVAMSFSWRSGAVTSSTKQTGVIVNPVGGLGPSVKTLTITCPSTTTITGTSGCSPAGNANFLATTGSPATQLNWSIEGNGMGKASGGPSSWTFNWNVSQTKADGTPVYPDCTYVVSAEALDDKDRVGAPRALTVTLNRLAPIAPASFEGGRNGNGDRVDLQWLPNPECDVQGYRVYRGTSPAAINTLVCPSSGTTPVTDTFCIDQNAPAPVAGQTLYYKVVGVDKDSLGALREGTASTTVAVVENNTVPGAPPTVSACPGGSAGCTDVDGQDVAAGTNAVSWTAATDPNSDPIYFYRIYRGGTNYTDRYDVLYPTAGKPLVFVDPQPGSGTNKYWVTAVDTKFGESAPVGPVSVGP
jgi:prepilin-type N-terminal cleavage/methylation domain-containing protein